MSNISELVALVESQALDEGLWFNAKTAPEAYLQQALRRLHGAIEANMLEQMEKGEPVGYVYKFSLNHPGPTVMSNTPQSADDVALYRHPARELSDDEISDIAGNYNTGRAQGYHDFARAILAAQKGVV